MVLYEQEFKEINECLQNLLLGSKAKCIFLVDKSGQLITTAGDTSNFDSISLASLTAGNFAATNALAQLMGQNEFSLLFHQGDKDNIHISVVESRVILVVIFDDKTSLGLIRLRVKNAISTLSELFKRIFEKVKKEKELTKGAGPKLEERQKPEPRQTYTENKPRETVTSPSSGLKEETSQKTDESEQKNSNQDDRFGDDFQKKASDKIDNLFMD